MGRCFGSSHITAKDTARRRRLVRIEKCFLKLFFFLTKGEEVEDLGDLDAEFDTILSAVHNDLLNESR